MASKIIENGEVTADSERVTDAEMANLKIAYAEAFEAMVRAQAAHREAERAFSAAQRRLQETIERGRPTDKTVELRYDKHGAPHLGEAPWQRGGGES